MLFVISPSTTLNDAPLALDLPTTQPQFGNEAAHLMGELKRWSAADILTRMKVSEDLAEINRVRYANWAFPHAPETANCAIHTFKGNAYTGLQIDDFSTEDLVFAQSHLRVFSALYGMLRPLDLVQPYRLDFKAKYDPPSAKNLYHFWWDRIDGALLSAIEAQGDRVLIDLTSGEYGRLVRPKALPDVRILSINFKEWRNGQYRLVSGFAKKARGMMARYALRNRISTAEGLKAFDVEDYGFNAELSTKDRWVFTRGQPPEGVI